MDIFKAAKDGLVKAYDDGKRLICIQVGDKFFNLDNEKPVRCDKPTTGTSFDIEAHSQWIATLISRKVKGVSCSIDELFVFKTSVLIRAEVLVGSELGKVMYILQDINDYEDESENSFRT